MDAIQVAEQLEKPLLTDLFTDVYHDMPANLKEQERSLAETIKKHPQDYPSGFAVWNSIFMSFTLNIKLKFNGYTLDVFNIEI